MKFNSKLFFRWLLFVSLVMMISYTVFQNFAFSSLETAPESSLKAEETPPTKEPPNYRFLLADEVALLEDDIQKKAKRFAINGSVLIAYKDQILYEGDFGYKDPTKKIPMQAGLSYQLASVSKQFTAAAVLRLHEEGLLDINDTVAKHLLNFKFKNVTIKDLLKHRSGLWDYMYLTERYWEKDIAPNNLEVVDLINKHEARLNFTPGRFFSYSNTGYVVLGGIVEQVTGLNLGEFITKEFLNPLCLEHTFTEKNEFNKELILKGYQPYRRSFLELPAGFHNNAIGDKGIYASARDLHTWFRELKNGKILNNSSVDLMFGRNKYGKNNRYGMGFRLRNETGEPVVFHNGLWDGFRNGLVYYPERELVVIVMTHTQNKRKYYFQKQILQSAKTLLQQWEKRLDLEMTTEELIQ